jgi:hypothetical protein
MKTIHAWPLALDSYRGDCRMPAPPSRLDLALALRQVMQQLREGGRALVVGHSPTSEAAVLGLSGRVVPPLGKGNGVLLIEDCGDYRVEPLGLNGSERFSPAARCLSAWS